MTSKQPSAFIPSAPLLAFDELIHRDLSIWADDLYAQLGSSYEDYIRNPSIACGALNQASLVAALSGDITTAYEMCHIQLKWLVDKFSLDEVSIQELMDLLQAWINIGRLYYVSRDYAKAKTFFYLKPQIMGEAPWNLIYGSVSPNTFRKLVDETEEGKILQRFTWINYVNETVKCQMKTADYAEGLYLVHSLRSVVPLHIQNLLNECELIFLEYLGAYDLCIRKIGEYKSPDIWNKFVLQYHLVLNHYLGNKERVGKRYCEKLLVYLQKALSHNSFIKLKKLTLMSAKLGVELGCSHETEQLLSKAFQVSQEMGDQRYAILFSHELAESGYSKRNQWEGVVTELAERSYYRLPISPKYLSNQSSRIPSASIEKLHHYIQHQFVN